MFSIALGGSECEAAYFTKQPPLFLMRVARPSLLDTCRKMRQGELAKHGIGSINQALLRDALNLKENNGMNIKTYLPWNIKPGFTTRIGRCGQATGLNQEVERVVASVSKQRCALAPGNVTSKRVYRNHWLGCWRAD